MWGKLLTVMTFSMATALLNLASLGVTARYVVSQLQHAADGRHRRRACDLPPLTSAAVAGRGAGADVGAVQRAVPGVRRVRPQHEGRAVLPDAAVAGEHAADDAADGAGRRAEPGQQPDSGHRRGAAVDGPGARQLRAKRCGTSCRCAA